MANEMSAEELAAARSNVDKFEPSHGWEADKRPVEWLTTGELLSLCRWYEKRIETLGSQLEISA
jgi:hypothetical protein